MTSPCDFPQVEMEVNNMTIRFPNQLFINNEFVDASDGNTFNTIDPATEKVSNQDISNLIVNRVRITVNKSIRLKTKGKESFILLKRNQKMSAVTNFSKEVTLNSIKQNE